MAQLNFNIEDICGTLAPKFDLRSWDPDYQAMTKGITMTKEELEKLRDVLNEMDFDKY